MATLLRGLLRGCTAWIAGYVVTLALVVLGVVETSGGTFGGAAGAFVDAHRFVVGDVVDPVGLIAVPVVVLGLVGYRAGRAVTSGLTGQLRAFVQSVRGTERNRIPKAIRAAVTFAGAYAVVAAVVAVPIDASIVETAVATLLVGLVVGVPTAVLGAVR